MYWAGLAESLVVELNSSIGLHWLWQRKPCVACSGISVRVSESCEHLVAAAVSVSMTRPLPWTTTRRRNSNDGQPHFSPSCLGVASYRHHSTSYIVFSTGLSSPRIYNLHNYTQRICRRGGNFSPLEPNWTQVAPTPPSVDAPVKGRCHGNHFWLSIYGVHIGATWRIRLNRRCAAAMRPYVKLLWPLVIISERRLYHVTFTL